MFSKTRILSLIGGCIVVLLILTGCQPGNSNQEIAMGTDGVPEEIVEAVVAGETIGAAQLTVEQQTIDQAFIEQNNPQQSFQKKNQCQKSF